MSLKCLLINSFVVTKTVQIVAPYLYNLLRSCIDEIEYIGLELQILVNSQIRLTLFHKVHENNTS